METPTNRHELNLEWCADCAQNLLDEALAERDEARAEVAKLRFEIERLQIKIEWQKRLIVSARDIAQRWHRFADESVGALRKSGWQLSGSALPELEADAATIASWYK